MLSPYQLGTLRTRTMSLQELDPCQAGQTEITCFFSGTNSKYKKGGVYNVRKSQAHRSYRHTRRRLVRLPYRPDE